VLYYPSPDSSVPVAGSIQTIHVSSNQVVFSIKHQAPLPKGKYDPFCRYPSFPATLYSAEMDPGPEDRVPLHRVLSHAARFNISGGRAVILNLSRVGSGYSLRTIYLTLSLGVVVIMLSTFKCIPVLPLNSSTISVVEDFWRRVNPKYNLPYSTNVSIFILVNSSTMLIECTIRTRSAYALF
jgi:hypothetical protein